MLYAVVDTARAEEMGFPRLTHTILEEGKKMILNENELLKVGDDIQSVAEILGGVVYTLGEVINIYKKKQISRKIVSYE